MAECLSSQVINGGQTSTSQKREAVSSGVNPICGMPTFSGTSVGQVLDQRYIITSEVSSDQTGVVYQAEDAERNVRVLIRALPQILDRDEQQLDILCCQAEQVIGLSHPNVVSMLGFHFDRKVKYMVTEYCDGSTLQKRMSTAGPLTVGQMVKVFTPLAEALDYAHSRNVLHLDINPANILLTTDRKAKLANFAITRQTRNSLGQITSEPAQEASLYAAPEQFRGTKLSSRSDIYSFAATIYKSLCRPPQVWRGWMEYEVLKEKPAPIDSLSESQNAALLKALSRDPANRYRSALALLADLDPGRRAISPSATRAEEKLGAELEARLKAEEMLHAEAKARAKAEQRAEAEAQARSKAEKQSQTSLQTLAQKEERFKCEIQARIDAEKRLETAELARTEVEKELELEAKARSEAEEQAGVYAERLAEAEERLSTVLAAQPEPEEHTGTLPPAAPAARQQALKSAPKVKVFVVILAVAAIVVVVALVVLQYLKGWSGSAEASDLWIRAQLSAAQQEYEEAIRAADAVITEFPRYASRQKIREISSTWKRASAARGLWLETERLVGQSRYEQAVVGAGRLLQEYPETRYAAQAKDKLPQWEKSVSVHKQITALLAEAKKAKDANDLDKALAAVTSILELHPGSAEATAFKAEMEATKRAEQQIRQITAQRQQQFEGLKAEALSCENNEDWEAAVTFYTKASALMPDDAQIVSGLALCQHKLYLGEAQAAESKGDLETAVEAYSKALSFKADSSIQGKLESLEARHNAEQTHRQVQQWLQLASQAESKGDFAAAVNWYRRAAETGDGTAAYKVGLAYLNGNGVTADQKDALEWIRRAAEAGNDTAMCRLGAIYWVGGGVARDNSAGLQWYHKAAEAGNSEAMYAIAQAYYGGDGVPSDHIKAFEWLARAAQGGNVQAMYNLAVAYYNGDGVVRDYTQAVEWFRRAATQDHPAAVYNLAVAYLDISDYVNAEKWFTKAADAGNAKAMYNLGVMYDNGYGMAQDYAKALEWYNKAAKGGEVDAMVNLGLMHHEGLGVAKDSAKAVEWYKQAAEAGSTRAMSNLAMAHYNGDGVTQNKQKAIKLLQDAAEKGERMAMFNLGLMYQNGWSVTKDCAKAIEWYQKAAETGDARAMYNLAVMYHKGIDVTKDLDKAVHWYQEAARLGHPQAREDLVKLGATW